MIVQMSKLQQFFYQLLLTEMSQPKTEASQLQICQMLANVLVTISKGEQILQCIREVLVSNNLFTPLTLFKYLSHNGSTLTKKNLIAFLDENNLVHDQKQTEEFLNRLFNRIGIHKVNRMQYTQFLHYVYPFNSSVLRDISTNKIKNYEQLDKLQKNGRPDPTVLSVFLLLLQEQIQLQKKLDAQISDSRFPTKDKLKKVLKSIKRASDKMAATITQNSPDHISSLDLRNFVRAFIDVPDNLFLYLGRKLEMDKNGQISLENMEILLRKTRRHSLLQNQYSQLNVEKDVSSFLKQEDKEEKKHIREINYREQLYQELASTLKLNPHKNRTPRDKSLSDYRAVSVPKTKTPSKKIQHKDVSGFQNSDKSGKSDNKKDKQKGYIRSLFRDFISVFLKGNKQIEKCKGRLNQQNRVDFLSVFKSIDKGRGIVEARDLERFYLDLSGMPIDYDFQLIIDRFAVADEKWLSYSEFVDIFRGNSSRVEQGSENSLPNSDYKNAEMRLNPQVMKLMAQIIYLTLEIEEETKKVIRKFNEKEKNWLFNQINVDLESKGFINYQELKKYLANELKMNLSMIELMSLLKRLDKSKNGVVVKDQFLVY